MTALEQSELSSRLARTAVIFGGWVESGNGLSLSLGGPVTAVCDHRGDVLRYSVRREVLGGHRPPLQPDRATRLRASFSASTMVVIDNGVERGVVEKRACLIARAFTVFYSRAAKSLAAQGPQPKQIEGVLPRLSGRADEPAPTARRRHGIATTISESSHKSTRVRSQVIPNLGSLSS